MTDRPPTPSEDADPPPRAGRSRNQLLGCSPSLDDLFRYMDGVLDDGLRDRFRSHIEACGGCGALYEFQASFRQLIGTRCRSELPPDLPERVFRAITDLDRGAR